MRVILASNSPRRRELLQKVFDSFDVIKSNFNEDSINEKQPENLVKILSLKKAEEVFDRIKNDEQELLVIGGDTIVYFDGQVLGKPKDKEEAYNTLKSLQGNENYVYSAFTIILKRDKEIIKESCVTKSIVKMKPITDYEINEYIKTGEPMDKAGSYAVQGIGNKFIENIEGSYNSVVGLDVEKLKEILEKYLITQITI